MTAVWDFVGYMLVRFMGPPVVGWLQGHEGTVDRVGAVYVHTDGTSSANVVKAQSASGDLARDHAAHLGLLAVAPLAFLLRLVSIDLIFVLFGLGANLLRRRTG